MHTFFGRESGPGTRRPLRRVVASAAVFGAILSAIVVGAAAPAVAHAATDRVLERVSPADRNVAAVGLQSVGTDDDRIYMVSGSGFADTPSMNGTVNPYGATRGLDRWNTRALAVTAEQFRPSLDQMKDAAPDLSAVLLRGERYDEFGAGFYLRSFGGGLQRATPTLQAYDSTGAVEERSNTADYVGASLDFSRVILSSPKGLGGGLLPSDEPPANAIGNRLYAATSTSIERIDVTASGDTIGPWCGVTLGALTRTKFNAVSDNGTTVAFTAYPGVTTGACAAARQSVFVSTAGSGAVEASASRCDRVAPAPACNAGAAKTYEGASRDGNRVFFTTTQQLTSDDLDSTSDLYEYDVTADSLTRVTPEGATVQGVSRISNDGNRIYLVAHGELTDQPNSAGSTATVGLKNLFLLERADRSAPWQRIFVGTLASADSGLWGSDVRPAETPDDKGRFLVFASREPLTADDTDAVADVFRFDAETQQLVRVSAGCGVASAGGQGPAAASIQAPAFSGARMLRASNSRTASTDGRRVAFLTTEALCDDDVNGTFDVYEWHDGDVAMITDGTTIGSAPKYAMSPSGKNLVFSSAAPLVASDRDSAVDVYTARVGGGLLPEPERPDRSCSGDGCQAPPSPPPALPNIGSISFGSDGNVPLVPGPARVLVRVSKLKAVTGSAAKLKVVVPGAGRVSVAGSQVRRAGVSASKAGSHTVRVALSSRAKRVLRQRKTLKVSARVTFRAKDGRSAVKTVSVTFKQPQAKKSRPVKKSAAHHSSSAKGGQ